MKSIHSITWVWTAVCILAACAPASRPTYTGPSVQDLAATIAAATIGARGSQATKPAAAPTILPITPTTKPTLFVNAATSSCRSGPGSDFQIIVSLSAGTNVELVARDSVDGYWVVRDPASRELCWLQVQDATAAGSFDLLPEVTPQPVAIPVPNQPGSMGRPDFACDNTTLTTVLRWYAPSGPVNGYRIYREGNQIADLPATQTSYTEKIPFIFGSSVQYAAIAYNDAGASVPRTWEVHCP